MSNIVSYGCDQKREDLKGRKMLLGTTRCEEREDRLGDVERVAERVVGRVVFVDGARTHNEGAEFVEIKGKLLVQSKVDKEVLQHWDERVLTVETPQVELERLETLLGLVFQ